MATTGYSVVDQKVLHLLGSQTLQETSGWTRSILYMFLLSLASSLWVGLLSLVSQAPLRHWNNLFSARKTAAFSTAVFMTLTYSLVLIAMNVTSHIGYIVALRQLSIPIGVLMGVILLKEGFQSVKAVGLLTLLGGIALVFWPLLSIK